MYLQVLSQDNAQQALTMNNGYFFGLLDRMISGQRFALHTQPMSVSLQIPARCRNNEMLLSCSVTSSLC